MLFQSIFRLLRAKPFKLYYLHGKINEDKKFNHNMPIGKCGGHCTCRKIQILTNPLMQILRGQTLGM